MALDVVEEVAGAAGLGGLTGWESRLKQGAYTPPKGARITYQFVDVSRATEKRTPEWNFSGLNDGWIDDLGYGSRKYPIVAYFAGLNHDILATQFEAALLQRGAGFLEHPLYGSFRVNPIGTVMRRNDLVAAANQSVVEVTFSTTLATIYPGTISLGPDEILSGAAAALSTAATAFADVSNLTGKLDQAVGKATIQRVMRATRATLQGASDQVASAKRSFDSNFRLLNEGLDTFVGAPLLLAQQVQGLIMAPARAVDGLRSRLEGYAALAERIFGFTVGEMVGSSATAKRRAENDRRLYDLAACAAITGTVESTIRATYRSRAEAIVAAEFVLAQLDQLIAWRDETLGDERLDMTDDGSAIGALSEVASQAAGYLVRLSFELLPERRMMLDRPRNMLELCAELYGSVANDTLELFEQTNAIAGSEFFELPRGREVVWYAA